LERAIGSAVADARRELAARDEAVAEGEKGFYLEFEIPLAERAAVEGLENRPAAIELKRDEVRLNRFGIPKSVCF
jgi:hypothetical protein